MTQLVEKITRGNALTLRDRLAETLRKFGEEHGVTVEIDDRSVHFCESSMDCKIVIGVRTPEGTKSLQQREFELLAPRFGLAASDYKKEFYFNGKCWQLVGFNPQAVKYPFNAEDMNTRRVFKLPPKALPEAAARAGFLRPIVLGPSAI